MEDKFQTTHYLPIHSSGDELVSPINYSQSDNSHLFLIILPGSNFVPTNFPVKLRCYGASFLFVIP